MRKICWLAPLIGPEFSRVSTSPWFISCHLIYTNILHHICSLGHKTVFKEALVSLGCACLPGASGGEKERHDDKPARAEPGSSIKMATEKNYKYKQEIQQVSLIHSICYVLLLFNTPVCYACCLPFLDRRLPCLMLFHSTSNSQTKAKQSVSKQRTPEATVSCSSQHGCIAACSPMRGPSTILMRRGGIRHPLVEFCRM